jgi:hypothetical protein
VDRLSGKVGLIGDVHQEHERLGHLALKGRRFETWAQVCHAVDAATRYWNGHWHPYVWSKRKRRRHARPPRIACLPVAA